MTHIKKMVMQGFKSFARKTDIPFENAMNVIVGPNGSGKSNITDALCFVLGRLSIKSIRAAKAANLLFSGNKLYKGSDEGSVELIFDNSDKTFGLNTQEVSIKRVARKNGQSVYKINNEVKTRQELLELLAQAGIDPNGFNIILQGEIQSLVQASPEERRKIIEEVAGISIYETRKEKSLRELEKTEEKLKEIAAVLRERGAYLKNLEKERQEALSYQKLEETIKKCKSTLISKNVAEKEKEIWGLEKAIESHTNDIEKVKRQIEERNRGIDEIQGKINVINKQIQSSTSEEQEALHKEISDLKADIAGLTVRKENFENRIESDKEKIRESKEKIATLNKEISEIQTKSPKIKELQERQKTLQEKFDVLEQQRRKFYVLKSELSTLESQKSQAEKSQIELKRESQLIEQTINSLTNEVKYAKSIQEAEKIRSETKGEISKIEDELDKIQREILEKEKRNAILDTEVKREERLKEDIISLQSCPVCKQDVGPDHKHKISTTADSKINSAKEESIKNEKEKKERQNKIVSVKREIINLQSKLNELNIDIVKIRNAEEKKDQIKRIFGSLEENKKELIRLNEEIHQTRDKFEKLKDVEEKYDEARLKIQEISFPDIDVDTEITIKQREVNRLSVELKSSTRDIEDSEVELKKSLVIIGEKEKLLEKKEIEEQKLYEKFQKFFEERNELQDSQKVFETDVIGLQHTIKSFDEKINYSKIQKAQFNAQIDSFKTELNELGTSEVLQGSVDQIKDRLQKAQFRLSQIGSVNMRALEVFEKVEEQVKLIQVKVDTIQQEKEKVAQIILEIDKKKKKSFMKTLEAVNSYFTRNFTQLSKKGEVFLELENQKDPFEGGLSILVKVSRGKYFDVASLSGGEKTLVALALIFAIQEYKPYCFYILDEIDAALDKHNSELLAALIKKYMTTGQYIIITHNDTLISEASNLYGVSMQENISKIISLKI